MKGNLKLLIKERESISSSSAIIAVSTIISAQEKKVDGGLAIIKEKKSRENVTRITPPGSPSIKHLAQHCTACQLCNSRPNDVLHPSTKLETFMQPIMKFDKGYCRPECNECSSVCPTGVINNHKLFSDKSAEQIGHAVWVAEMYSKY